MDTRFTNDDLKTIADGCTALANQFDKGGMVKSHLLDAGNAVRELLELREKIVQGNGGECVYIAKPGETPGVCRPGEPLPRPFAVAIYPYAKWYDIKSAAQSVFAEAPKP